MRKILMSFTPKVYKNIKSGAKIFEYRRNYCSEPSIVYMYVSSPIKKIMAIIYLDKRISLDTWLDEYSNDFSILQRIQNFQNKNYRFAMPILSFQEIEPISLYDLKDNVEKFVAPQSYVYIDKNKGLEDYISLNETKLDYPLINCFNDCFPEHICKEKY